MFHFSLSRISSLAPSFLRLLFGWDYSLTVWDDIFTSYWCSSWVGRLWCQRIILSLLVLGSLLLLFDCLAGGNRSASASEIRCLSMVSFCIVWRFLIRHLLVIYFVLLFCMLSLIRFFLGIMKVVSQLFSIVFVCGFCPCRFVKHLCVRGLDYLIFLINYRYVIERAFLYSIIYSVPLVNIF